MCLGHAFFLIDLALPLKCSITEVITFDRVIWFHLCMVGDSKTLSERLGKPCSDN